MSNRLSLLAAVVIVSLAGACARTSPEEHLRKADLYFEQGSFAEAVVEYRSAVQGMPRRGDVRMKLAETYIRVGSFLEAIAEASRASDVQPQDVGLHVKAGNILLMASKFDAARSHAERALAIDTVNLDAMLLLGNAQAGLKAFDEAIREYQDAILLKPAEGQPYVSLASVLQIQGKSREAEETFRKAIGVAPANPVAHLALANFLWTAGRRDEAEQSIKKALAIDPANASANRAIVVLYMASHRLAEAEPYVRRLAKQAGTTNANLALADYYVSLKRSAAARQVLMAALSKPDGYVQASVRIASLDDAEGQRAQAMARVNEVLTKFPKEPSARLLRAKMLRDEGKIDKALAEATAIVREDPGSAVAAATFLLIGRIAIETDRYEEATEAYAEVLRRDPKSITAALSLAALNLLARSADKAAAYVTQALQVDPRNLAGRALQVRVLLAQNNRTGATAVLETLRRDVQNSPTVLDLQALMELTDGRVDTARALYLQAVKLAPDDVEATSGLVKIELARGNGKAAVARVEDHVNVAKPTSEFLALAAQTYDAVGDLSKEEAALRKAIEVAPNRMSGYSTLGAWYARQNRLEDARAKFEELVVRNPKSVWAGTMLGMVLESLGKPTEAEKRYETVLAINPEAAIAANNLAYRYLTVDRNTAKALELAQAALRQSPGDSHINDTLGWAYYRYQQNPAAVRYLEASVKLDATNPVAHYHLGMAYVAAGDTVAAKKAFKQALLSREFANAEEARKALAEINGTAAK